MKKHRIASIFSAFLIVVLCVSLFTACNKIEIIEENQVEKIVARVINNEKEYEMTSDEAKKFIKLFNTSKYEGKSTGEGGTPEFGISVYFSDGSYLLANEFDGLRKFEVFFCKADGTQQSGYYISSEELYVFAEEMVGKVEKSSD